VAGRILVVGYDGITALDIEETLAANGYEVATAVSVKAGAIKAALRRSPDLVVLDDSGSFAGGIATARQMCEKLRIPVVFLTALIDRLVSAIRVRTYTETKNEALPLLDEIEQIHAAIRRKAHELFEHRRAWLESDLDNWLGAERQVLWVPTSELLEDGKRYLLRAALPGRKPEQIQVTALPHMLVLKDQKPIEALCDPQDWQSRRRL